MTLVQVLLELVFPASGTLAVCACLEDWYANTRCLDSILRIHSPLQLMIIPLIPRMTFSIHRLYRDICGTTMLCAGSDDRQGSH